MPSFRSSLDWRLLAAAAAILLGGPAIESAQSTRSGAGTVRGTIRDSLGYAIAGAQLSVIGTDVRRETDERGEFALVNAAEGTLSIGVRRIGYRPDSTTLTVVAGQTVPVNMVLSRLATELQSVVVLGRQLLTGPIADFYKRRARGIGLFLTREELDRRNLTAMTDIFRMVPGADVEKAGSVTRVRFRGEHCAPLIWIDGLSMDGMELDLDLLTPRNFEGIEIYKGPAGVPVQYLGTRRVSSSCGTIILWSRQGEPSYRRRKGAQIVGATALDRMVKEHSVFTAGDVDVPAAPDWTNLVHPVYPDSLYDHRIAGRVLAEFVVDEHGQVVMETFSVVTSTHPALTEAVRRAIGGQHYSPAQRHGTVVQQVVQQPFDFVLDSATLRKK